jgi:hypothetical protein
MFTIHCGNGVQKIRWVAEAAVHRFDPHYGMNSGWIHEVKLESGINLNQKGIISEELTDDIHVYVLLEGKFGGLNLVQMTGSSRCKQKTRRLVDDFKIKIIQHK